MKVYGKDRARSQSLTESAIKGLKPRDVRYMVSDSDHLYLEVRPNGGKSWIYRARMDGKNVKKVLGGYPGMGLYEARQARDRAKREIPVEKAREARAKAEPNFETVALDWFAKYKPTVTPRHARDQESRLRRYVLPALGAMYPFDMIPRDILPFLQAVQDAGHVDLAHDLLNIVGMVLRHGVQWGTAPRDFTVDLRGALVTQRAKHYPHLKSHDEIGILMQRIYSMRECPTKWLLLFNIYTFVRPSEARLAVWSEIDMPRRKWLLPEERMLKNKLPHLVPLSNQVMELLHKASYNKSPTSDYVFRSSWSGDAPFSENALIQYLKNKWGYSRKQISIHGFRSMASTALNEHGWPPDAIERQLSHVSGNAVRRAYNHAEYLPVRVKMVQWYADYLDALRDGTPEPPMPTFDLRGYML